MEAQTITYVGIDVAQQTLAIAVRPSGEEWSCANDDAGLHALGERLQHLRPASIVLEATGGYELPVSAQLAIAGLPIAVVKPRQTRAFVGGLARAADRPGRDADRGEESAGQRPVGGAPADRHPQ